MPVRNAVLLSLMLVLGACSDRVVSDSPWFNVAAANGAPELRPGLWSTSLRPAVRKEPCRFDERRPLETWPECASGYVVRKGEVLELTSEKLGQEPLTYDWNRVGHLLASGDPRIDQVEGCPELDKAYSSAPDGSAGAPLDPYGFCYNAVRPTRFDAAGRIVAVVSWPVLCGPWPTEEPSRGESGAVTVKPFPGLHVVHQDCTAESEQALRGAAKASEAAAAAVGLGPVEAHWVRDAYR